MSKKQLAHVLMGAVLCAAVAQARKPGEPFKPGFNLFSKQQDIQLGQEAAQQVQQQYQVVQNQFLTDYLNRVGQRLAATKPAKDSGFPFSFKVLNVGEINAFALPGGSMFVYTGLMKAADNEAQLVGVMAHEMSHVILRHGTHEASKANLIQLPAMLAGAMAGGSMLGQLAQLGVGLGANSVLLKFSRDAETQADLLGTHMMSAAGYNPIEMSRFFEKLAAGGSQGPQFLSDHPNPGNRQKAIQAEILGLPQSSYGFDTGEFARSKTEIAGLPAPPPPNKKPGVPAGSAKPPTTAPSASGWKRANGQGFSLAYPSEWQVFGDQQSSTATIAPREGLVQAADGTTAVGYGAVLSFYVPQQQKDLQSTTDDLVANMHNSNQDMRVVSSSQRARVGGSDALVTMLESASPYGGTETDALVTVLRPEGLFYMVFVAPSKNFQQLQGTFQQMMNSIQFPN